MDIHRKSLSRLLFGQVPADFADWVDFVAITSLLAFHWQVELEVYALLSLALGLPYLVVGPMLAKYIDKGSVGNALIFSSLGR
ncbi:hypothetical protein [Polycladidibacter stylochi]|uniref:hypothetical protein n=1 Tax=Polycladidibacter stylochi TaxID=1807766 RepID=UPI00138F4F30|nr:hypothetical protein [Pseudovibrio stylochi]